MCTKQMINVRQTHCFGRARSVLLQDIKHNLVLMFNGSMSTNNNTCLLLQYQVIQGLCKLYLW